MVPLQKLLGKEDRFFDLFEASAEQARDSVRSFRKFITTPEAARSLDEFGVSRRKEKSIAAQISETLCTSFVSSMEAADIEALSSRIYKIPKTVEKIAERILLAPKHLEGANLEPLVRMMEQATDALLRMVRELRKGMTKTRVKELNDELQAAEGEADRAVIELLRGLYNAQDNPGRVAFQKDVFELLEKVTDCCRDAGNVISQIVLKSS